MHGDSDAPLPHPDNVIESHPTHQEEGDHKSYQPEIYYADDLPSDILETISPVTAAGHTFTLASKDAVRDNIGVPVQDEADFLPDNTRDILGRYIVNEEQLLKELAQSNHSKEHTT